MAHVDPTKERIGAFKDLPQDEPIPMLNLIGRKCQRVARQRPEMPDADPFDLNRFVTAQAPVFAAALDELKAGRKQSHWMWFVFPQLRGLGHSRDG